jgi:hypothetical protein
MRKLIIGLAILVVLLIGAVGFAVVNVNSYLKENRDTLAQYASEAAGRDVSFESAHVAYADGLAVRVGGLQVAEDPNFGETEFLQLDEAFVGVRIWPALQRRIEVSSIRLDAPNIRVIQTKEGFNFSSLGGETTAAVSEGASDAEQGGTLAVAIAALEIIGGTISYEDRSSPDGLRIVIENFESSGTDLALEGPIAVDFSGEVHSTKSEDAGLTSRIAGSVAIDSLETAAGTVHVTSPSLYPAIFGVRLEEAATVPESLDELVVDVILSENPEKAGYAIQVRSSEARLSGLDLTEIIVDLVYRDSKRGAEVKMDQISAGLVGGQVNLSGDVVLGEPGRSPFHLNSKIRSLDLDEIAHVLLSVPRGVVSGRLGGDAAFTGDSLEWETLKKSLAGSLNLEVGEGALEKVNILDSLIGRITADPLLGRLAGNSLREISAGVLNGNRTPFNGVDLAVEVVDGAVRAKDFSMSAGDFSIKADGTMGLDGGISADGTIRLSKELSRKILAKSASLGEILGDGGIVTLPLRIGGTASSPTVVPDIRALTLKASAGAKQELTNRAAKEIGDAIFGKKKRGGAVDPDKESNRNSTEGLIREGLGRLLGR